MRKEIGKIQSVKFGYGGYRDAQIGISFALGGKGWGVGDFWGTWAVERSNYAKWTEEDRIKILGETVMRINKLLSEAGVSKVEDLKNIPVEVTFDGMALDSWRILTEVI